MKNGKSLAKNGKSLAKNIYHIFAKYVIIHDCYWIGVHIILMDMHTKITGTKIVSVFAHTIL